MEKHCEKIRDIAEGYFEEVLSNQARENVETHLKECPDCVWFFREYEKMNEILSKWKIPGSSSSFEENVINTVKNSGKKTGPSFIPSFLNPAATGLTFIIVLGLALLVYYFSLPVIIGSAKEAGDEEGRAVEVKTGDIISAGEAEVEVLLNDGSKFTVSKRAKLRIEAFKEKDKSCFLEGDLKAEIRKYPGQEFKIKTANAEIGILGTVLFVSANKLNTLVSVVEGSVAVKGKTEKALITKGNIAIVSQNSKFMTTLGITEALKNQENQVRIQAIRTIFELRGKQDMQNVSSMLEDLDPRVRMEAAAALCAFGKEAIKPLVKILRDKDKFVRAEAVLDLGKLKAMEARDRLKWMREDKDVEVRINVALALQSLGEQVSGLPELLKELDSTDLNARINALKLARKIGNFSVSENISKNLANPDNNVKWYAILALERIKNPKTFPALLSLLKDRDDNIRKRVIQTLVNINFSEAVPEITALLSQPGNKELRFPAIRALGYLLPGYYRADRDKQIELLLKSIDDPERLSKVAALIAYSRALGATPALKQKVYEVSAKDGNKFLKETLEEILKVINKQDFRFMLSAIEVSALSKMKEKAVVPVIFSAAKDQNPLIRKAAMEAFERLNNKIFLTVLYEGLKDSDSRVAEAAEEAIKKITE